MIDIENYVFTALNNAIKERYPDAVVVGDYIEELATYPTVTITEIRNATVRRMQDDAPTEHYATITYEINAYSNERIGKKEIAKDIIDICDGVMLGLKFVKGLTRRLPAIDHLRTVYRMYARYTAVVGEGIVEERDGEEVIVHRMYRS